MSDELQRLLGGDDSTDRGDRRDQPAAQPRTTYDPDTTREDVDRALRRAFKEAGKR
jgi:hypothetical protein